MIPVSHVLQGFLLETLACPLQVTACVRALRLVGRFVTASISHYCLVGGPGEHIGGLRHLDRRKPS